VIHPWILHNQIIRSAEDRFFSPGQVGLLNGWGVFSTVKVVDGVLFAFPRHWARMRRDAELLRVPFPWDVTELNRLLLMVVNANEAHNATLRVSVIRNKGTMFEGPGIQEEVELVAFTVDRKDWGTGVRLGVAPNARHASSVFAGTKILAWATNLVWYEEARLRGQDEVILLNERGEVSECTSANLFASFGDTAVTPPLRCGCLPGVTRELLLEEVSAKGIRTLEQDLRLDDLERADGLFITSSTRDLLPVVEVEGLSIGQDDHVRQALNDAFARYEQAYVSHIKAMMAPG
jgi:branched-chain amino acid aminotransferase